MRQKRSQTIGGFRAWAGGFAVSLAFIWIVSFFFWNNRPPLMWDDALEMTVRSPGVVKWRSEGWADTHYGKHGLLLQEEPLALSEKDKFILWGDSHVEAWQVSDADKISSVYNKGAAQTQCIGIGQSGWSVADYFFKIPLIEKHFPNVKGHVILLSGLQDTLPTTQNINRNIAHFSFSPNLKLTKATAQPHTHNFIETIDNFSLRFLPDTFLRMKRHNWHFSLGISSIATNATTAPPQKIDHVIAWNYLLSNLRKQSLGFIAFVYCPDTPRPAKGEIILVTARPQVETFAQICKAHNIDFIDMSTPFKNYYLDNQILPRGFFNSPQGLGHLNQHGLKLVAQTLKSHFEETLP